MSLKEHQMSGENVRGEEAQEIIHELQVYQTELEMQNENLQRTKIELDKSIKKYFDLFDLAPIGYVKMNEDSVIQEANLIFSQMVGSEDQSSPEEAALIVRHSRLPGYILSSYEAGL